MKPKTVDDYIAMQPVAHRPMLEEMRSIIRSVVPSDTKEVISYMIPCYKYNGMLVGFGKHNKGCSFYAMHATIGKVFPKELKDYDVVASTIHFEKGKKLPAALLKKIIRYRIKQNEERTKAKLTSKK